MIESPLLDELFAEREVRTLQAVVLEKLENRFGTVPADLSACVRVVTDQPRLKSLLDAVYSSATLDAFRQSLTPPQTPATTPPTT